ncbi:MAG: LacI family DNA-binding transcriptional regulator [Terracidiphilus sp.]|nr:LacI family DNA-binding transcriptional regulator [Terracidiphilus sp.]MDR3775690.1 LacI family DNA-binding transcriptional regulator [Terracidiphilus sp.]
MHQIAREAGVSLGTVSHVINGTATVSEPLRQRVMKIIKNLGYEPNELSRGLRLNKTNIIGMLIPDITNPFFPGVVRGVEDVAYKHSYRLVLCNTDNDSSKEIIYLSQLKSFLPAGIVIIPSIDSTVANNLSGPPVVCVDRRPDGWKGDFVTVANREGAYKAARHLIEMGHRKIGVIAGPSHLTNAMDRLQGFLQALHDENLPISPEYIQEALFDRTSGYTSAIRLLQLLPRPTAIFTTNDLMAMGALSAVRESKLSCPADVSIISFDGLDMTELTDPALTTVYQPGYQLGYTAARLLLERMEGSKEPAKEIALATELRVRNSVANLNARTSLLKNNME